jgi:glycosyltransferase involved in cell wall biosynthesis
MAIENRKPKMKHHRILFVDHTATLGGAELHLIDLATAYRQTSRVLLFADGPLRKKLEAAGVEVIIIEAPSSALEIKSSTGLSALKAIPALWWLAGSISSVAQRFDLIHANSQKAFIATTLATFRGSPPLVWHLHDILTAKHFSAINRRVAVALANARAAKVIVNSRATGEAFVAAGGSSQLIELVYNGFASSAFNDSHQHQAKLIRSQLGIENAPLVGSFSRLSYWKGQHVLLEALKKLPQVHALLVGATLFGEDEYTKEIEAIAAAPELVDRVHWLGFRDDVPALMSACDAIVHTSTEPEPFGRVIVEGQLTKKPVIAAAAGGAIELIQDRVTGRLIPPGDPIALAGAIEELFANKQATAIMAQKGYHSAKTNFTLDKILQDFDRAIARVFSK